MVALPGSVREQNPRYCRTEVEDWKGDMDFKYSELVKYPLERVYTVLRDNLPDIVPFLPNVESIQVLEREETDGRLRLLNHWQGESGAIPRIVRPFVTREMKQWHDEAVWIEGEYRVEWTFSTKSFENLYDCSGVNSFEAESDETTRVSVSGTINVYPARLRAVPKLLARKARPKVEEWLVKMITPNLAQLPQAVQAYLDQL